MCYNPYICIICWKVKDNGWYRCDEDGYDRCVIVLKRLKLDIKRLTHGPWLYNIKEHGEIMNADVCNECFKIDEN